MAGFCLFWLLPDIPAIFRRLSTRPLLSSGLGTMAAAVMAMLWVDRPLAIYFKYQADPALVAAFESVTEIGRGDWYFAIAGVALVIGLLFARRGIDRKAQVYGLYVAAKASYMLSALAAAGLTVITVKLVLGRVRPRYLFESDLYGLIPGNFDFGMNSFPSGHSQVIWTVVTALCLMAPPWRKILIPIAVVVSLSRVVVTAHYASDVIVGAYVGIATAILLRHHVFPDLPCTAKRDLAPQSGIKRRWRRVLIRSHRRPTGGMAPVVTKASA